MTRHLSQAGDTIVEVMIAIAVISLVLVGAYVSTNRNIRSTQDAQERTQAVKLAQTQIEYIRSALVTGVGGQKKCFDALGNAQTASPTTPPQGSNPCIVKSDGSMAGATDEPAYTIQIRLDPTTGIYKITVTWDSLISGTQDNVTMYYSL